MAAAGRGKTDYTVTVSATIGTLNKITAEQSFKLTVKNPCIDANLVSIRPVVLPTGLEYTLYDFSEELGYQFTHDAFQVMTSPFEHDLCGKVDYLATFDGSTVTEVTTPVRYDSSILTFEIYSEDLELIGDH